MYQRRWAIAIALTVAVGFSANPIAPVTVAAQKKDDKKQDEAHNRARDLTARLKDKYPQSDYSWRASAVVYKLDQGVPVYGIDRE